MLASFALSSLLGWIAVGVVSIIGIIWLYKIANGNDWDDC
jgi:hypothetical protein